jgi:starvation-inducible DNA-binding protein
MADAVARGAHEVERYATAAMSIVDSLASREIRQPTSRAAGRDIMSTKMVDGNVMDHATPLLDQHAAEIQPYGHLVPMPIGLSESVCRDSVEHLNQLLADTVTLRDLYRKHHWQVLGPTFYPLHLLFDQHAGQQTVFIDAIAERIQMLGGISLAMAADIAEASVIPRPPKGREEVPVQIARLLHAHAIVLREARSMARQAADRGDDGTCDLIVTDVIRTNEKQVWFLAEHVVETPLVRAK